MSWESGITYKFKIESDTLASFSNSYEFKRPIVFKRYPDITQNLVFDVYDVDSMHLLGRASFRFSPSFTQKDFLVDIPIVPNNGSEEMGTLQAVFSKCAKVSREFVGIEITGKNLVNVDGEGDKSDPFLVFHRYCQGEIYVPVHCTTALLDNLNPKWERIILPVDELCDKDGNSLIKIECWDWQQDLRYQFMGEVVTTLNKLRAKPVLELHGRNEKIKTGELIIRNCLKLVKPSPMDFLTTKDRFSFVLGIDFSEYNQKPFNKRNLHEFDKKGSNTYLKAIEEVSKIMWGQDSDGKIPSFGFGGRPSFPEFTSDQTHSLIPLNGNRHKMSVTSPEQLAESYKNALKFIDPTERACISDLVKIVRDWAIRDIKSNVYHVLIILTAGHLHNIQGTIDILVDIAHLPISIILVGIGDNDFGALEKLDGDKKWLRNSKKKLTKRDIVNFVDFGESYENLDRFGRKLLEEFPEQFMSYKLLNGDKNDSEKKQDIQPH